MVGYDMLNTYKDEAEQLRRETDVLLQKLMEKNETVLKEVHPDLIEDYRTLKRAIKDQKDENEQLYKQLLTLKKDTANSSQKISLCTNRIVLLENHLGEQTTAGIPLSPRVEFDDYGVGTEQDDNSDDTD